MKCAHWPWGFLTVALIAGCGGDRRNNDNSAAGTGTETGTMQGAGATSDTAIPSGDTSATSQGISSDTAHADAGMHGDMHGSSSTGAAATGRTGSDSATANQTKSGVTDAKTGKSTLGRGVTQTRPDQGQPVTSKGDTVGSAPDSTQGNQ